jgi:hypothetical protein
LVHLKSSESSHRRPAPAVTGRAAGVPGSAHGVRKIAATRAANHGATVAQLEAIFGWSGGTMASHYTRSADRQRLAIEAMHKLANNDEHLFPHLMGRCGRKMRKRHEINVKKISVVVDAARGGVAGVVGIEAGVINLESSGVGSSDWRPRHEEHYQEV